MGWRSSRLSLSTMLLFELGLYPPYFEVKPKPKPKCKPKPEYKHDMIVGSSMYRPQTGLGKGP